MSPLLSLVGVLVALVFGFVGCRLVAGEPLLSRDETVAVARLFVLHLGVVLPPAWVAAVLVPWAGVGRFPLLFGAAGFWCAGIAVREGVRS